MSGGHFDYNQRRILDIAESVQHELDIQGKPKSKEELFMEQEYYDKHPEEAVNFTYPEDIQKEFKKAVDCLEKAYIYAQRIDWYLSGDDGEDSFRKRLKEELIAGGFLKEEKIDHWAWVKDEYCALFKAKNPSKGGKIKESTSRMKAMFKAYPHIRKEDVILTVKYYLSQTDSRYIRYPHYFLKKGVGANAIYEFDDWYNKYLENKEAGVGRDNVINTMQ